MDNIMSTIWATLKTFQLKDAIDIIVISLILYYLFKLFRQSRSGQLVKGLVVLVVAYGLSAIFNLTMVNYILRSLFEFAVILVVVVFQPELRNALERLGRNKTLKNIVNTNNPQTNEAAVLKAIGDVSDACAVFSKAKTGALICFERDSLLNEIANTGTALNSDTSAALLGNIFYNKAPLHDGAMIIRDERIVAAACILQLSDNTSISRDLGTRHRAAIGITEATDAVSLIVSEETGIISMAREGRLTRHLDGRSLTILLTELFTPDRSMYSWFGTLRREDQEHE